jgi:CO dehydrogenase/acetyl-CoA synthase epsilon subunit
MQVINNDSSKLEEALEVIKKSQITLQNIFCKLKTVAPRIIQINPQPTQTLISDLKHSLMIWGKQQHEITDQLGCIQQEFSSAIATISDIKVMFDTMLNTSELKNCHLKEAANYVSKSNKDIESVFAHVTQVKKMSILKIQSFFTTFFKIYYTMLYDMITPEQKIDCFTLATQCGKLPLPDAFFAINL